MYPTPDDTRDSALDDLRRQQRTARKWGLIVVALGLAIGALVAPNTALLVFVALVVFGTLGWGIGQVLRVIGRWFDGPQN